MKTKVKTIVPILGKDKIVRYYIIPEEYFAEYDRLLGLISIKGKGAEQELELLLSKFKIVQTDTYKTFIKNGN